MTRRPSGSSPYAAALALLTGRALTCGELTERLRRRGFAEEAAAAATARAAACGFLDDRRTAVSWAESAARTLGPRRVRAGLARRLLSPEVIEEAVAAVFATGAERGLAREALKRWERTRGAAVDEGRRRAAYAHLLRRGFSPNTARAALLSGGEDE